MSSSSRPVLIATRGSALALAQANLVLAQCRAALPGVPMELRIIKTTGDKLLTASLSQSDLPKGLFTKELETALLAGEADLAVHSLKDLPTDLPPELKLGAVSVRADVRDVLIYRDGRRGTSAGRGFRPQLGMRDLPQGATVATSSTRRSAQLLEQRPDLKVVPIRGNVGTRMKKLMENADLDATILAAAGLSRLGMRIEPDGRLIGEGIPEGVMAMPIEPEVMLPCVGQAALGLEIAEGSSRAQPLCAVLDHPETHQCVRAERAFLQAMGGGCHLAVAALGRVVNGEVVLRAVSFLEGQPRRGELRAPVADAEALGQRLAAQLQTKG